MYYPKLRACLLRFRNYSGGKNTRISYQDGPVLANKAILVQPSAAAAERCSTIFSMKDKAVLWKITNYGIFLLFLLALNVFAFGLK